MHVIDFGYISNRIESKPRFFYKPYCTDLEKSETDPALMIREYIDIQFLRYS